MLSRQSRFVVAWLGAVLHFSFCIYLTPSVALAGGDGGCPRGGCGCGSYCGCLYFCGCGTGTEEPVYEGPAWTAGGGKPQLQGFNSLNVQLLSWFPVTTFNAAFTSANTCEGYVSKSGREYAIVGLSGGTGFVEVTDPANAQIVTVVPDCGTCSASSWRDIKVYDHYAYIVSEATNTGLEVYDLSQIDDGVVTFVTRVNTPGSSRTHTLEINQDSGYAYRCGGGSTLGLRIYSLANPAAPVFVTTAVSGRYFHECQAVTYTSGPHAGKEIVFGFTENSSSGGAAGVTILDVTDKQNIITLTANYQYTGPSFSHQGWVSEDKQYLYLNDETDGNPATRIISISNLSAPVQVGSFSSGLPAVDHNLYVKGRYIFESNYRSGLRIFDAINPTAPVHVAYFDTYEANDNSGFNGLWDNYPFLPSGIVLGSDIERGLFIWCFGKTGDMNNDLRVDDEDVNLFVDAMLNSPVSTSQCSGPDLNGDGDVNGLDVEGFKTAYVAGP